MLRFPEFPAGIDFESKEALALGHEYERNLSFQVWDKDKNMLLRSATAPTEAISVTGLEKETIISLAKTYAQSSPSLIRVLIGMEHQVNGASAFRAVAMLPALTGAWRHFGGGLIMGVFPATYLVYLTLCA